MQRRNSVFNESIDPALPVPGPVVNTQAFVPWPSFVMAGFTPQQLLWQQQVYQQALAKAQAAMNGPRLLRVRRDDLPQSWRN